MYACRNITNALQKLPQARQPGIGLAGPQRLRNRWQLWSVALLFCVTFIHGQEREQLFIAQEWRLQLFNFRHWIVGLGSGDLIIHRSNTNQEIDMPNVLFIAAKVRQIEQLIKERQVV